MISLGLWTDPIYQETAALILATLAVLGFFFFVLKKNSPVFSAAWASIQSWFIAAPLILGVLGLADPAPFLFLTLIAILSAKIFFQMVGIYHRSWFIWTTYISIFALAYLIRTGQSEIFNLMPMIFAAGICMIPILRNSATHMIQYLALSLVAFIFWGWSFMHMAKLLTLPQGVFIVLYLYLLAEISQNTSLAVTRLFGKVKIFSRITSRITLEGIVVSVLMTLVMAWALRHLLPDRSEHFWIAAGLIASLIGRLGDLTLAVIRKDLGIKNTGVFIIGRGDLLARVDKLIFVGPLYFYTYLFLQRGL